MNYTASSVQKELSMNSDLDIRGEASCPQNTNWLGGDHTSCSQSQHLCDHVQDQSCEQTIFIDDQRGTYLTFLTFIYTISPSDFDGLIDEHDQRLKLLLKARASINTGNFKVIS
jgi:hypothetical protein